MKNKAINKIPQELEPKEPLKTTIYKLISTNPGLTNHELVITLKSNSRQVRRVLEELVISDYIKYDNCDCYNGCPIRKYQIKK